MAIPQLTTDGGRRPLTRGLWNPATWMTYIRCGLDLETLGVIKEDMQRLVITIQTREAELGEAEAQIERLTKERDTLKETNTFLREENKRLLSENHRAYMRTKRLDYQDILDQWDLVMGKTKPRWIPVSRTTTERTTTERTTGEGMRERTVTTNEVSR